MLESPPSLGLDEIGMALYHEVQISTTLHDNLGELGLT